MTSHSQPQEIILEILGQKFCTCTDEMLQNLEITVAKRAA